jgi:peptidyl-tRNA hydrolase
MDRITMKQVIVVNTGLDLPPGKLAAQVAHASVSAFLAADISARDKWLAASMTKIVLAGTSEDALERLQKTAQEKQIPACLVRDAGKTVVSAGTITCLGLGPAPDEALDPVTGGLPLL